MPTQAQITANTANATKLGFHAKYAVLLTEEDHQAFDALSTAFRFELHPTGPIERALHSQITLASWNIERANRLEAALAVDGIDPLLSDANEKTLNRIATYRMRAERTFHKSLKELQSYQAAHPLDEPMLRNEAKVESKNEPKNPPVRLQARALCPPRTQNRPQRTLPCTQAASTITAACGTNPNPASPRLRTAKYGSASLRSDSPNNTTTPFPTCRRQVRKGVVVCNLNLGLVTCGYWQFDPPGPPA